MIPKPEFIQSEIHTSIFDGIKDDLLTGGFGKSGLMTAKEPAFSDADNPQGEELRSAAIYYDYRGLMDMSQGGGYGLFFGPGVNPDGSFRKDEGKIAGKEYLTFADEGRGQQNVTLMLQIPENFDPENPCIIATASSGSRGIYGAVGVVGEWALRRGFAVAYTDKGTGTGIHDLHSDTVSILSGQRQDAASAGQNAHFRADADSEEFRNKYPFRIAVKHAHSRQNPEKDWGKNVLQAIAFAFYILNLPENFGRAEPENEDKALIRPENTPVIAAGISNGGSAVLRAAEQDSKGLIRGVVASEPNICPRPMEKLIIRQGDKIWKYPNHSRNLLDYHSLLSLYQPCANLSPELRDTAPLNVLDAELCKNRCRFLAERGLLTSSLPEDQAREAQKIINDYGILEEQNRIQPAHYNLCVSESIALTYANAYGQFSPADNLAGFSFAGYGDDLRPAPLNKAQLAAFFCKSAGIPPMPPCPVTEEQWETLARLNPKLSRPLLPLGEIEIINNESESGPMVNRYSVSGTGVQDMNSEGALRLRRLAAGKDEKGNPLHGEEKMQYERIQKGIAAVRASGNLRGLPVIIFHGRSDAVLPPNHSSRPYLGLNRMTEGENSGLRYYEILNAHHMDAFNILPGFASLFVPIHYYMIHSLDLMLAHLKKGKELPPDQLVRTVPRGCREDGSIPPVTKENVPDISENPVPEDKILFLDHTLIIPE
ncbi:MAG: 3-hydroxybutyrate oligomer hydrolase family protein [Desulfococcaceae bacterium]|jgi:hydroxybutyrate-dimer hydrolase|nr:3-hydroxybutyrate oligomer hydrolase family protein [Desulfococcaceae bacterium]